MDQPCLPEPFTQKIKCMLGAGKKIPSQIQTFIKGTDLLFVNKTVLDS